MASTVQEKDIKRLRGAGNLAKKIGHRLPPAGQVVPTLDPHERVVFLPHLFVESCITMGLIFMIFPQLLPQYLDVHRHVRGFSPDPTSLRPMAKDFQCEAQGGEWRTW